MKWIRKAHIKIQAILLIIHWNKNDFKEYEFNIENLLGI
jgi:hypothetical protein